MGFCGFKSRLNVEIMQLLKKKMIVCKWIISPTPCQCAGACVHVRLRNLHVCICVCMHMYLCRCRWKCTRVCVPLLHENLRTFKLLPFSLWYKAIISVTLSRSWSLRNFSYFLLNPKKNDSLSRLTNSAQAHALMRTCSDTSTYTYVSTHTHTHIHAHACKHTFIHGIANIFLSRATTSWQSITNFHVGELLVYYRQWFPLSRLLAHSFLVYPNQLKFPSVEKKLTILEATRQI